jgi:parvulin-like peptidyl-prolyl isomerase
MKYIKHVILIFCLLTTAALPVSAISIRSLLGLDEEESKTEETSSNKAAAEPAKAAKQGSVENWAKSNNPQATAKINLAMVKQLMANLDSAQRSTLLADEATFNKFIWQEANNLSVISAAQANNVQQDANTTFLMQRGADNILREIYLKKLIDTKLPEGFPSDQQIQEYFDKNQEKFVIAERLHVWQIFLPVSESMDKKTVAALRKKANVIAQDIRKGKINFNNAAIKHSQHAPSNANGGYMGLIKTADLKPDIQKALLELGEGKISQALTTDTGIHIVKRGAIVPERKVSLEEGKAQIRALLIKQVRAQLRKAIFEQAAKTYAVELPDNKIEEWRLRLKTNLEVPVSKQ